MVIFILISLKLLLILLFINDKLKFGVERGIEGNFRNVCMEELGFSIDFVS